MRISGRRWRPSTRPAIADLKGRPRRGRGGGKRGGCEVGSWDQARQSARSERAVGTGTWRASGSTGEETATGWDGELRPSQRLSGGALSGRAQSALRAPGGGGSRLSPATAHGAATGRSVLAGGGTSGERRLGGALQESAAAAGTAKSALGTGQESRAGARKRSRGSCDSLSRSASHVPRAEGGF